MDPEIEWAGQICEPGTPAHARLVEGLRKHLQSADSLTLENPVSSRGDAVWPNRTPVVLCHVDSRDGRGNLCVKLYPPSDAGLEQMRRHEAILRTLQGVIPVPEVVERVPSSERFGFPALITTAIGEPLDRTIGHLELSMGKEIVTALASAMAILHRLPLSQSPIRNRYTPENQLREWHEDAAWCADNAPQALDAEGLVRTVGSFLAVCTQAPDRGCLTHRDLTPYNILVRDGRFAGLVDWDHAGMSPLVKDVASALIGILIISSLSPDQRLLLSRTLLQVYSTESGVRMGELFEDSLPSAKTSAHCAATSPANPLINKQLPGFETLICGRWNSSRASTRRS